MGEQTSKPRKSYTDGLNVSCYKHRQYLNQPYRIALWSNWVQPIDLDKVGIICDYCGDILEEKQVTYIFTG